jgi:hypothetical protein
VLVRVYTNERPENPSPVRHKNAKQEWRSETYPEEEKQYRRKQTNRNSIDNTTNLYIKKGKVKQKLSSVACLGVVDLSPWKSAIFNDYDR